MAGGTLGRRWGAAAAVVAAVAAAVWVGTGVMTRRALAANVPTLPPLEGVPAAVRAAVQEADALARSRPSAATVGALGRAYHAGQLRDGALAAYAAAEALAPDDWTWPYLRALLLEERNEPDTDAALRRAADRGATTGHVWYRLAERAFKERRLDDADAAYARAADAPAAAAFLPPGITARQTWPLGAYAGVGRARVALERGDAEAAGRRLRQLTASYPGFGPAQAMLRLAERGTGAATSGAPFVPPADPALDAIVAASRHSDLLLKYAGVAAKAGDAAWREYLVRRALSFNPDDLNVLMEMSAMLQAGGRPAEALEYLKRHEALAPGDHHTLVQQGRLLADLGRDADAETVLRRAALVRDTTAEFNLGTILDRQNRWDEARLHYERALAIDPFNTSAMNNLAAGLDRHGQAPAAIAIFERALDIEPDNAGYYVNYGSALIGMRRLDDAIHALTTSIALEPRDPNAHNNLGIALAQQARLSEARASFERALQLNPSHVNARRNLQHTLAVLQARP